VTTKTRANIAVLTTNLFFAVNYSLVKYISPSLIKPYAVNLVRVGVTIILLWLVWLFGKTPAGIKKQHVGRFILCAVTGVAINQMLFVKGLTMTSTIHASLLMLCTPLLITIFAFWILKEKLSFVKAAGLALGIGGSVLLILAKENSAHTDNYLLGDIFIIINAISYAFYFILVKPLMKEYSPVHIVRWIFTIGFVMIIPFSWVQFTEIPWGRFDIPHTIALLFVVIGGTFLAYYFNAYGILHLGAGITGSYIYTQPIFAAIIATIFLGEPLTFQKIVAAILIFAGVFLVSSKRNAKLGKLRARG
jgi:drug/metabolite transporter (DMT)-like permease